MGEGLGQQWRSGVFHSQARPFDFMNKQRCLRPGAHLQNRVKTSVNKLRTRCLAECGEPCPGRPGFRPVSLLCHALLPTSSAAPLQPLSCFQNCSGSQGIFQGTFQGTHRSQGVGVWGWFSGAEIPSPMQPQCQDRQLPGSLLSWSPAGTQWTFTLTYGLILTRRRGKVMHCLQAAP